MKYYLSISQANSYNIYRWSLSQLQIHIFQFQIVVTKTDYNIVQFLY